ncbi:methionyl-tRNA formyltransferase [Leptospira kanakyensis]|uniref:methionyl-tRNA formyltransferase n=1 Tax=Leptospira kanakyensis TaxID=2484968 RepID=UPI00223DA045|nr:formyltransferase family protein [Leptospira kanakyensis]MCW7471414.1 hypothetical protein [Leptospira kanakyensis]
MKILFIGCVLFSKDILELLIENQFEIIGVISKDDTGFNADYYDISKIAENAGIEFIKTKNVNEEFVLEWVKKLNPDVVYCFGWNSLLGKEFIQIPPKGVVGYHPANLPQNRGRHPIIWSLVLGLDKTASTFFYMGEGADDGDIVSQKKVDILYEDDANSLYNKLLAVSRIQVLDFTDKLSKNQLVPRVQDHSNANVWRKRSKVDGSIDFRMSAESIYNLVRALAKPYPGALVIHQGQEYSIWKVSVMETPFYNFEPGKIIEINKTSLLVKCGLSTEAILIEEHELPDKLKVGDYL